MKSCYWCFFFLVSSFCSYGQDTLRGKTYVLDTNTFLSDVEITNLSTGQLVWSSANGDFAISAKTNDLLSFSFPGYRTDTLLVTDFSYKRIYLTIKDETRILKEVEVKAKMATVQMLEEARQEAKLVTYGKYKGGISFSPSYLFSKQRRNARKRVKMLEQQLAWEATQERFRKEKIKELTPLEGENLDLFMVIYRPTKVMNDKQLEQYIMDSYSGFKALSDEEKRRWKLGL
ncbi:hypothetical protein [Olivibacter sitiensis]|uniref:hypothetical protein n=1 Tax=Olivibacter sitiensis TaxID=376470 RepID=UPI000480F686|nr:hypothetical protein [Olivibacter sitiensis]